MPDLSQRLATVRHIATEAADLAADIDAGRVSDTLGGPVVAAGYGGRTTPAPPADPGLRDAIINAIGPHTEACQDTACRWCDDAARRADAVLEVVAEYLGTPLADLARRMRQRARDGDGGADAAALGEFADELNREVARPPAAMGGD